MLDLLNIKKSYPVGGISVNALNGVNLNFNNNEFVAILGPSGCGKTTLLNLIGGLDRYTSGDILIDGKSTKDFRDADWDSYRNATIGFVFQSYNLINHLSVLDNVMMALKLSGVSTKIQRIRAKKVLEEVGLHNQIHKKPNQLSGGQTQRVAIARALVNNPKILLADEPTGALDSKTSQQIMKLIQEISKDRLVIMVTHNHEIANTYATRVIKLLDGQVIDDTAPKSSTDDRQQGKLLNRRTSMPYLTAINSSFKNLLTKLGRTMITSIAGSIGIIGIALVLSISSGMTSYVSTMESDTLSGFPININEVVMTFGPGGSSSPLTSLIDEGGFPEDPIIYSYDLTANTSLHTNIITEEFISYLGEFDSSYYNSISYSRDIEMNLFRETSTENYIQIDGDRTFVEIPNNATFIQSQYDVLIGHYPSTSTELNLIIDSQNRLDTKLLDLLGITLEESYSFDDFIGMTFHVVPNDLYYDFNGTFYEPSVDYAELVHNTQTLTLEIVGIMRVSPEASSTLLASGIGYTTMLTDTLLEIANTSTIVRDQLANTTTNLLNGLPFNSMITQDDVLRQLGGVPTPSSIQIYPVSFDEKDEIKAYIDAYNVGKLNADMIIYTDLAETISSTITGLIDTIALILAAFAGISLIVSSLMIGIITYVSVIERTKEIGIMRSLGARKKDISRIFNAETMIIGFSAGLFGIVVTSLAIIPINWFIEGWIGVANFAQLSLSNGLMLIALSTLLTLLAGSIPSYFASKKDPVVALRTE